MPYASDALADAMNLAQVKAMNSFTFSDCLNYLNYAWSDIYSRVACIDDGFYAKTVQLTTRMTVLPNAVKNTTLIYRAQAQDGFDRTVYRRSGPDDINSAYTYNISGKNLFCPDAEKNTIWMRYVPAAPMLFFTHHNRDPKVYDDEEKAPKTVSASYNLKWLCMGVTVDTKVSIATTYTTDSKLYLINKIDNVVTEVTDNIMAACPEHFKIKYLSCDYPYIFATWESVYDIDEAGNKEYRSGFFDANFNWTNYNPFDYAGKGSNVEYISCSWNDKTGMGVIVKDHATPNTNAIDNGVQVTKAYTVKELGWTPDMILNYPAPEMYRYLVARLADKFSAMNESNVMGVQKELIEAKYAFEAYLDIDKSSFKRIVNVNSPNVSDLI